MLNKAVRYWYTVMKTPIGPMTLVATSNSLFRLDFGENHPSEKAVKEPTCKDVSVKQAHINDILPDGMVGKKHANDAIQKLSSLLNQDNKRVKSTEDQEFKSEASLNTYNHPDTQLIPKTVDDRELNSDAACQNKQSENSRENSKQKVQLKWYDPSRKHTDVDNDLSDSNEQSSTSQTRKSYDAPRNKAKKEESHEEQYVYLPVDQLQAKLEDASNSSTTAPIPRADCAEQVLRLAKQQLDEYFLGKRKEFSVPLDVSVGTEFQKEVWARLCDIPYGETWSYADVARRLKSEKSQKGYRAVGNANNRNPISVIIPCHRVIQASGALGGYGGGCKFKQWLLEHEAKFAQ